MSSSIKESTEYLHMVAEGIPEDAAWGAAWIDRAYNHLVRNGMAGSQAYAQAIATWVANSLDFDVMTPEDVIYRVLGDSHKAMEQFAKLDPAQPAASFFLQRQARDQRNPS